MTSVSRKDEVKKDLKEHIPDLIVNPTSGQRYSKGRFLGKGGFAKCYELQDLDSKEIFAGKIVSKTLLVKQHQKDKMTQEISIHRDINYKHVVKFHCFFEDSDNVYILLELCRRRSLMELHKRRKAVTEPEARYFVRQIVLACQYLHSNNIIHRDLKLGNLFINDDMDIKVGDFGLATRVDYSGERKKTLCGTPNYIAPEVLGRKGHSFEVDAWSLGCILYTLLVGKAPFESSCLKDIYMRIKKNEYHIPSHISPGACKLIQKLLHGEPSERPSMDRLLQDEFFTSGYMPLRLPTSCLTMTPRFDTLTKSETLLRKPLLELNGTKMKHTAQTIEFRTKDQKRPETCDGIGTQDVGDNENQKSDEPTDFYLNDLLAQLSAVLAAKPSERADICEEDAEDPASVPIYWVSKWVDYSDKYGLGYQLCDNSVGVFFNDSTRLMLLANGENIQYIERDSSEHFHTLKVFPEPLTKKVTLLKYFQNYMSECLLKAGANMTPRDTDDMVRLPFLREMVSDTQCNCFTS